MDQQSKHSVHSKFREQAVEHLFIGEVLKVFWNKNETDVEVLRSEFDLGGYDIVISRKDISRFVQFKTALKNGSAKDVKVSLNLARKPNGCIVLLLLDDSLNIVGYKWFGSKVGSPFPDISRMPVVKHSKGDAKGNKAERADHRVLKHSAFENCASLSDVVEKMFY